MADPYLSWTDTSFDTRADPDDYFSEKDRWAETSSPGFFNLVSWPGESNGDVQDDG